MTEPLNDIQIENQLMQERVIEVAARRLLSDEVHNKVAAAAADTNAKQAVIRVINEQDPENESAKQQIDMAINERRLGQSLNGSVRNSGLIRKVCTSQAYVQEVLTIYRDNRALLPVAENTTSGVFLKKMAEIINPNDVSEEAAPYLFKVLNQAVNNRIGEVETLFGLDSIDLQRLKFVYPATYEKLIRVIKESAAELGKPITDEQLGIEKEKTEAEQEAQMTQDYQIIRGRFIEKKDLDLIDALFRPKQLFGNYVENDYVEFCQKPEISHLSNAEKGEEYSKHFHNKVSVLFNKIVQNVFLSKSSEPAEKSASKGSFYSSPEALKSILNTQITKLIELRYQDYPQFSQIQWFKEEAKTHDYDELIREEGKPDILQPRRFVDAEKTPKRVESFNEYLVFMKTELEHEIEIAYAMKNLRALKYMPTQHGQEGFWGNLTHFLKQEIHGSGIDEYMHQSDSTQALAAARLLDKFMGNDMAHYNNIYQPTYGQIEQGSEFSKEENEVIDYLKRMYPMIGGEPIDDMRAKKAVVMGSGDHHAISLRAEEIGSLAEPPKTPGNNTSYASYSEEDAKMYKVFNQMAHENMRFSAEELLMGNLLFLKIKGNDVRTSTWDHKKLIAEMEAARKEFTSGKSIQDEKNGTVRFINWFNPARVGSMYSRGGWRDYYTYSTYLVPPGGGKQIDVVNSFKALENIGVELLKDFCYFDHNMKPGQIPETFYDQGDKDKIQDRKELVTHIYKRYYKKERESVEETNKAVDKMFEGLEKAEDIKEAYKSFYHKMYTRALVQRVPTLFLRIERTKDISGRDRSWAVVKKACQKLDGWVDKDADKNDMFLQAAKDIGVAESILRDEVTEYIRQNLKQKKLMHEIDVGDRYQLTEEKLKELLVRLNFKEEDIRYKNAIKVYKETHNFLKNAETVKDEKTGEEKSQYLDNFAKKIAQNKFPFAFALEEMERSFLAHRGAGENMIGRATNEINDSEKNVATSISKLLPTLRATATGGKNDFSEIIKLIKAARDQVNAVHGTEAANTVAYNMAALTISFFKRDTLAKPLGGVFGINRINSIAAEFSKSSKTVWEWDSRTIDHFITLLETDHILPDKPYEANTKPEYEPIKFDFLGIESIKIKLPYELKLPKELILLGGIKIPLFQKNGKEIVLPLFRQRKHLVHTTSYELRQQFGGDGRAVMFDMLNNYFPMALALLLFFWIKKSFQEAFEKKK